MLHNARILIADDAPEMLETLADALTDAGADVVRAANGVELIEKLAREGPFALIITDIAMPWVNGLQAMVLARNAGAAPAVIVMTALRDERIPDQVRALGRDAVLLRKPFELAELESVVHRLLRSTVEVGWPSAT